MASAVGLRQMLPTGAGRETWRVGYCNGVERGVQCGKIWTFLGVGRIWAVLAVRAVLIAMHCIVGGMTVH